MAKVERILIREAPNGPSIELERAAVAPGEAIAGDRYASDNASGTFYEQGKDGQDVTLIEAEALEDTGLSAEESGRNIVTRGIALNDLVGKRFRIGAVQLSGNRLCEPCATLRDRTGVFAELVHRGGLRADVLVAGEIAAGDEITEL
jgi:MOSC domain-containing protein YiiM